MDGVESTSDTQWNTTYSQAFSNFEKKVPIYAVLGNHDYHSNPEAQIDYSQQNIDPRESWKMPSHEYNVIYNIPNGSSDLSSSPATLQIIFIDTCILAPTDTYIGLHYFSQEQAAAHLASIETALAASTATWLIVAGHYPIFSRGEHGDSATLTASLLPLLRKYGVQAYLNGHDHTLQHISWQGVDFFVSGHGSYSAEKGVPEGYWGATDSAAKEGARFGSLAVGFGSAEASRDTLRVSFMDQHGQQLYSTVLTNPRNASSFYVSALPVIAVSSDPWSNLARETVFFLLGVLVGAALCSSQVQLMCSCCCRQLPRCCWSFSAPTTSTGPPRASPAASAAVSGASGKGKGKVGAAGSSALELHVYSPMALRDDFGDEDTVVDFQKERYV